MIPDYNSNIVYLSPLLEKCHKQVYEDLTKILRKNDVAYDLIPRTKNIWCRDYMPLQLTEDCFLSYKYRPDYLIKNKIDKEYISDTKEICLYMKLNFKTTSLIIDGGNIVKAGNKVIMTEKVFAENSNISEKWLKQKIRKHLDCEVIFIPWDKNEKYGHSDGILKPIDDETILLTNYQDFDNEYYEEIKRKLSKKFRVETLQYNVKNKDSRNWSYINFLTVGNLIVLPQLGIEEDSHAFEQIKQFYPNYNIEKLNIVPIIKKGGRLNCITWCRLTNPVLERFLIEYNSFKHEGHLKTTEKIKILLMKKLTFYAKTI